MAALLALSGCGGGSDDAPSAPPPPPAASDPPPVAVPTGKSPITLTASTPAAAFAALQVKVTLGKITVEGAPKVYFSLTDTDGNAIVGFGSTAKSSTATVASYPNLAFALAKLVPGSNSSPSKWVSYIVSTVPTTTAAAAPARPSTDNTGTLVDYKDGTYSYTFYRDITKMKDFVVAATLSAPNAAADLGDLSYNASLTHRLVMTVSGAAPGTGSNTPTGVTTLTAVNMSSPVNVVHDFIPSTGKAVTATDAQRTITDKASCNECHGKLGGIVGTESASFHSGNRYDSNLCVVCHTAQRKYGRTNTVSTNLAFPAGASTYIADGAVSGDFPVLVHKLHLGAELAKQGYNYAGVPFNEIKYPQDIRNCSKCHSNDTGAAHPTPQGNNWKSAPSALACGACHDGINFATGKGVTLADAAAGLTSTPFAHPVGPLADDALCSICHKADAIAVSHIPVTPPNPLNSLLVAGGNNNTAAAYIAGNTKNLPAGAILVSYDLKSVTVDATTRQPSMVFRMLQNGVAVPFNTYAAGKEMWDGFVGSPSAYFVFAVPQDGIAAPADFNASVSGYLRGLWAGTAAAAGAGTLTGPDASGYYTVTLTGVKIPSNAVMLTGGLGYSYGLTATQPLTQSNLAAYPMTASPVVPTLKTGGLIVAVQDATMVATGYTGRRTIVADGLCDKCHEQLGVFTAVSFHAGQRNDGASCSWCHTPNRTSSGWSADSAYFVHAIHAGAKRSKPFTWHAVSTTDSFANVGYPGVLSQCETCHVAGTYDFSATASASALLNRPYRAVGTGKYNGTASATALAIFSLSPYVVADNVTDYGAGFSFNAATGVTTPAAGTTLVISPVTSVCFACHDSALATSHMQSNGGSIYAPRSAALNTTESCTVCHGPGKVADIKAVHPRQ
ncbi:MAG: OmcA/MtrC family decaheme c-type cytochrome [Rubrivivax sp.]|nr:OmcA/MtrC family decaheme c-type cytochrome [Rubrivivax sp.]